MLYRSTCHIEMRQVPEWQELAKDRPKWRKMLKSIRIRR
jgi:hypothetical protein